MTALWFGIMARLSLLESQGGVYVDRLANPLGVHPGIILVRGRLGGPLSDSSIRRLSTQGTWLLG